jgi:nanoRNase/pAp phosphatase (c-di-AMP/oligoRNAs hydrolase)
LVKERDERVAAKVKEAKLYRISGITEPVLGVEASDDISVLGNALAGVAGLGMVFRVVGNAAVLSFRSKDGHSALEAAKALGGGGHGNAAGATVGQWMVDLT